jgi:hypothetical protein
MKELDKYHVVASAVRVEHEEHSDTVYLVFEIVDEKFKQQIKDDWMKDINLKIIDKQLVIFEEE